MSVNFGGFVEAVGLGREFDLLTFAGGEFTPIIGVECSVTDVQDTTFEAVVAVVVPVFADESPGMVIN